MVNTLEIDSVNKSFDDKKILTDIYIKINTCDIVGVFGRNGSGKSTLLEVIFGSIAAENKFIKLNNDVIDDGYKTKNLISFLPQKNFIPTNLGVKKVIELFIEQDSLYNFYEDSLINKNLKLKISSLSFGELKYLQVKLILYNNSKFCLLDEPYSGISPQMIALINQQIIAQSKFKGIIITDHNFRYVLEITNKNYLIKNGACIFLKEKNDLVKLGYLKEGMF